MFFKSSSILSYAPVTLSSIRLGGNMLNLESLLRSAFPSASVPVHSGRRSRSAREGGNRRRKGGIPRIGREHGITLAARKGTAPPTTATSAITSAATAGATTAATATREGDGHCYLLDAEAGEEAMPQICASSPLISPPKLFS
jgi:hypothetical protein